MGYTRLQSRVHDQDPRGCTLLGSDLHCGSTAVADEYLEGIDSPKSCDFDADESADFCASMSSKVHKHGGFNDELGFPSPNI